MEFGYTLGILLLPLLSFLVIGLPDFAGNKYAWSHKVAGLIGTCTLGIVTVLCYIAAFQYFSMPRLAVGTFATIVPYNYTWLPLGSLHFDLGILLDPISVIMPIVISTVSFMVHIYSFGYMHGEKGFQRYYAFLSLFTMSMLGLVLATNIFQMYMFWELVGVSSYLLIGFYYELHAAVHASKKAFIVTRFADMFFLVGILIFGFYTGSFNFSFTGTEIQLADGMTAFTTCDASRAAATGSLILPTALVLMFIGGAGKSAMFPLHIWLPDAMEGPTPVSALIHAATMVVAGVVQIARLFPLWIEYAPQAMSIVVVVGAFTAFYAAAIACAQSDIKRVLAFSTISQIAFMMVALGVSLPGHHGAVLDNHAQLGYMASMFHLFTHAMFKALLFLVAGAVIHAVHSNENSAMHGLRKYMPISNIAFLIGCLAISGIPPFAGFFSKDEILVACYEKGTVWGLWMSMVAGMTAFYMFRIYFLIFHWKEHEVHEGHAHPHEGPWTMSLPLIALSAISVVCGLVPFGELVTVDGHALHTHTNWTVAISSVCVALVGIGFAFKHYYKDNPLPTRMKNACCGLLEAAYLRFYMDEFYQFLTHKVIFQKICKPIAWFDRHCIDGFFNLLADLTNSCSFAIRRLQSGNVQSYVYVYLMGALLLAVVTMACVLI